MSEHLCAACGFDLEPDGFCGFCGKQTNLRRLFAENVQAELDHANNFSRKVPGELSGAEIRRVAREHGIQAATMLVGLDAVYAALKPGKASLR